MLSRDELPIHEEVMLLALKDDKGTIESGAWHRTAVGGAILAELLLRGRIEIEPEKKKRFARVVSTTSLGDDLLDECLRRIHESQKRQQLRTWVSRFARTKDLQHRVARRLCRRGILRATEDKVLLIFKRRLYPEIDPGPERAVIERMREAILGAGEVAPRTAVLIAIAQGANLLKIPFAKKELKQRKQRLEEISSGDAVGAATQDVVKAAQAAAAMVVITSTTT